MFYSKKIKELERINRCQDIIVNDMASLVFKLAVEVRQLKKKVDEKEKSRTQEIK